MFRRKCALYHSSSPQKVWSYDSVSEEATPCVEAPHMLVIHFTDPVWINLRPVMGIVEIHLAITFESCLISPQNSELEITIHVWKPVAEINTSLEAISRTFLIEINMEELCDLDTVKDELKLEVTTEENEILADSEAARSEAHLQKLENKTFSTGSVLDTNRSKRPKNYVGDDASDCLNESLHRSLMKSSEMLPKTLPEK
ncbi:hypothetical protein ANN_27875 [Periplaneta americana]|uniref:Uncharacterized protein n=1 Tax=Periplaneta americana TaxID=6978 RepID=A0ABQ8RVD2_PERAM|nr:hypothetical protein ANN_27875 [Periplaneta americana]